MSEYQLTVEKRPLYLYVCVQGPEVSRAIVHKYLSEILDEFRKGQYSRMLIKKEIAASLDPEELDHVASDIVRHGAQGLKIAIVDENSDGDHTNKLSARNAMGLDVGYFKSFAPAVHWLLHG